MTQTTALRLSVDIVRRTVDLQSTAEYISALANVIQDQMDAIRREMRDGQWTASTFADCGDWQHVGTILSLLQNQSDIVHTTAVEFELASSRVAA